MGRLRWLTAGESHGRSLAVTIEGVPAGLRLEADDLLQEVNHSVVDVWTAPRRRCAVTARLHE